MIKTVDDYGTEGIQMDIFDYGIPPVEEKEEKSVKKFYFKCKKAATGEIKEIIVLAKRYALALEMLESQDEYIPLEYTGWTEISEVVEDK